MYLYLKNLMYISAGCVLATLYNLKTGDSEESELFRAGQSFYVPGNSRFKIETDDVLDYVCHFEG